MHNSAEEIRFYRRAPYRAKKPAKKLTTKEYSFLDISQEVSLEQDLLYITKAKEFLLDNAANSTDVNDERTGLLDDITC